MCAKSKQDNSIPETSSLEKLIFVEKDARAFGFDWPNVDMILEQVISECHEIRDAYNQQEPADRIQEEIGDLLHTAISLSIFAGFEVEETLFKSYTKFSERMAALKELTRQKGLKDLRGQSIELMLELWGQMKKLEKKKPDIL